MQGNRAMLLVVLLVIIVAAVILMSGGKPSIADAISSGEVVTCTVTGDIGMITDEPDISGKTITANVKVEAPKIRMEGTAAGMDFILISDGTNAYINLPIIGDWYIYSEDIVHVEIPTYEDLVNRLEQPSEGVTVSCETTEDIPDSEFELPSGVVPKELPEWVGNYNF